MGRYICQNCQYLVDFHLVPIVLPEDSYLDSVTAAFTMSGPISNLIHEMKYKSVKGIAEMFGKLLYLHTHFPDSEVITYVPISTEKRRVRGFNQAEVIAKAFSAATKIPVRELLIKQDHSLISQASKSHLQERLTSSQKTLFHWKPTARPPNSVILIDDVYTTGTTLNSCTEILKSHGVKVVHGLVISHGK